MYDNIDVGNKMAEKADNKWNLSGMSKSFTDAVRNPKKSREESVPDAHMIATSTPVSKLDLSESPTSDDIKSKAQKVTKTSE